MSTYFWDIGVDLSNSTVRHGLAERYFLPANDNALALSVGSAVFRVEDQVNFNLFNITEPTIEVSSLSGAITFTGGGGPFNVSSPIAFTGIGPGNPGQSAVFGQAMYYPHWMVASDLRVSSLGAFRFGIFFEITLTDGTTRTFTIPDPEMIVGSDG